MALVRGEGALQAGLMLPDGSQGIVVGSRKHGHILLITICAGIKSELRVVGGTVQVVLESDKKTVPFNATFKNLTDESGPDMIRANAWYFDGENKKVWLNKWNMVDRVVPMTIESNQFTDTKLHVDRDASPPITDAESKEKDRDPSLRLKLKVDTDTWGDEVGWAITVPRLEGGVGPGWPSKPKKKKKASDRSWRAFGSCPCERRESRPRGAKSIRDRGDVCVGGGGGGGAPPRDIFKATLSARGEAAAVHTHKVDFTPRSGTEIIVEVLFKAV